jgi:uncharacterized protein
MSITRNRLARVVAALVLVVALCGCEGPGSPQASASGGEAVQDGAGVLQPVERSRIAQYHEALRAAHDIDYRVLTIAQAGDLERTAHDYFGTAGVGARSENGRGLLLVIDPAGGRVRLEVATSLEGVYTDAFVAYVQTRQMAPFFAAGRVADGILATTELIVGRAQEAVAGAAFAPPMAAQSMGGGASVAAAIGTGTDPAAQFSRQTQQVEVAGLGALEVVSAYHERMAGRDARTDLPLYSAATVAMLANWVVTPAQMDNVVRTYRDCVVDGVRVHGDVAVVRYRVGQRRCAPYFLRREAGAWKLDLATLSGAVRFNHENQWHFAPSPPPEFAFAFADWRFDDRGFPHPRR